MRYIPLVIVVFLLISEYKPFFSNNYIDRFQNIKFIFIDDNTTKEYIPIEYFSSDNTISEYLHQNSTDFNATMQLLLQYDYYIEPTISISDKFFTTPFIYDHNFSHLDNKKIVNSIINQSLSTFGSSSALYNLKPIKYSLSFEVSSIGNNSKTLRDKLPTSFNDIFEGRLLEPVEFFFLLENSSILGKPTIARSSGNENVDNLILSYIINNYRRMNLVDGYYRFYLPP